MWEMSAVGLQGVALSSVSRRCVPPWSVCQADIIFFGSTEGFGRYQTKLKRWLESIVPTHNIVGPKEATAITIFFFKMMLTFHIRFLECRRRWD
ncbi:uncharacterized protein K460DRAFT_1849 [Cucurbitaria berberidis CBS 394.84]|uniref:Uncharacterized protein n=1 Tax=Cucurbitaria berberidis CBS 394.84 TaxID=1168544 RepID=A0A9P4GQH5_9PLEO|nr:uncharacterized protein K460DRAFT_1849 [Cucurbitaria berberidis CBS 394.84]KAF1849674.1 hypothetical protein K460DRAFT_1849 [Cucurbitaria berberidis CBS 394.84]